MTATSLPREIAPGVFWLGECAKVYTPERTLHAYNSVYLIAGEHSSLTIEAGHPEELGVVESQIEELLKRGIPEVRHCFVTHTETPHSAGIGRLLARFPEATAFGDVSDLHLVLPEFRDRIRGAEPGESVDLGGRVFSVVEAIFRDHIGTRWGFDETSRILFAGDGFAYSHYHEADQCGRLAEEISEEEIDLPKMVARFAGAAFNWTTHTDIEPYIDRLDEFLFEELRVEMMAPTHGLPIGDPEVIMPYIREGLRIGSRQ